MAALASAVSLRKWDRDREFLPWVVITTMVTLLFFLGMVIFLENPFVRYWVDGAGNVIEAMFQPAGMQAILPPDGIGLNPMLRHPGMVFPGKGEPDAWDFLYASFTIGMTAQVSDVVLETRALRQAVLVHAVASFFYNTCILALAVNAAVTAGQ